MAATSSHRWHEFLDNIVGLLPAGTAAVVIDGPGEQREAVAGGLAAALRTGPDAPAWGRPAASRMPPSPGRSCWLTGRRGAPPVSGTWLSECEPGRHVAASLASRCRWYLSETRAFFSPRAATWDTKFGDDMPAYAAAIAQARIRPGHRCRLMAPAGPCRPCARRPARTAPSIAADLTPEMLRHARARSGAANAVLIWGDARQLPLASGSADAVFAAGLVNHMPDPEAGLRELARVTRPGGLLIVFHPSGRPALAGTPAARSRISRRSPG
jgi:hypothetical protein